MCSCPTYFQVLLLGTTIGGAILFAFINAWVFGREYSDRTVKELLALPTPRGNIVGAEFVLMALWIPGLTLMVFAIGLGIEAVVGIPGYSIELVWASFWSLMLIALLTFMLMTFVTLFASVGRGYLSSLGWALITMASAQIAGAVATFTWWRSADQAR